ncbi:MAG: nucleoside deaminase [Thermodesulfobacteriota bacterium]
MTGSTGKEIQDVRFMEMALDAAEAALKAGEFPVGCVIADESGVLATGARTGTAGESANEVDHAEMTALRELTGQGGRREYRSYSLYTTLEPCLMCYAAILLTGIGRIVYAYEDVMGGGLHCDLNQLPALYRERRAVIVPNVLRGRSLALFKAFFQDPDRGYWRDSYLARYTLEQG